MNKLILIFLAIGLCTLGSFAQETHNYSEFQLKSVGTVYITESDSLTGEIYYNALTSGHVTIKGADGKDKKFSAKEVIGFKTQNPAKNFNAIKSDGLDKSILFYENITPNQGKKLWLVKAFISEGLSGVVVVNETVTGKWEISIYNKAQQKVMGTSFKKIAEVVKDCAPLSQKIEKKEKGYYFGFVAPPLIQEQVFTNIVTEYNSCN